MAKYSRDPRWITVKYSSQCKRCGKGIGKAQDAYYYPIDNSLLCAGEDCGKQASREFSAAAFDETMMSSSWS